MTPVRLLAVALLISSLPTVAQNSKLGLNISHPVDTVAHRFKVDLGSGGDVSKLAEPWRIIPNQPANATPEEDPLSRLRIDEYKLPQHGSRDLALLAPLQDSGAFPGAQRQAADTICYSIRNYLVARDSKSSDATHPAGYSTCQPASRYHVKTAVGQTRSDR